MQYILMLYSEEAGWSKLTTAEQKRWIAAYQAYTEALKKAGVLKGGSHLESSSVATTVRVTNGRAQVLDGPFIDPKEQLLSAGGAVKLKAPQSQSIASATSGYPMTGMTVLPGMDRFASKWSASSNGIVSGERMDTMS